MTAATVATKTAGRPDALTKKMVVAVLADPAANTRYYLERVTEMGYLEKVAVKTAKRGRPAVEYVMTGKGKGLVALAKNWK